MEPSIHEPALMQTIKEQFDNHNDFLTYVNEFYKDLTNYYEMLKQIESTTKEISKRIQKHYKNYYKHSYRGVNFLYEAKKDTSNMMEGISFLKNLFEKISYKFMRFDNPQTNNIYIPEGNVFILNEFRELGDPRKKDSSFFKYFKKKDGEFPDLE